MRRRLMTGLFLCALLVIARPAHAQVDNQCQGGGCGGDGGGGYDVGSCAPSVNGQGYNACSLVPHNPDTGQALGGVSDCAAVKEVIWEMGGLPILTAQGFDPIEGQVIYNWQGYFGGWYEWQYYFGTGVCRNY